MDWAFFSKWTGLNKQTKNCKKFMYVYSPMKIPMSKQNAEQKRRKVC